MMCKFGTNEKVLVKIPADLACSGKSYWDEMPIDRCISSIVKALQEGGIDMSSSCCGHGRPLGDIRLQDGRILLIDTYGEWAIHRNRLLLKALWCHFIYPKRVRLRVAIANFLWRLKKFLKLLDKEE